MNGTVEYLQRRLEEKERMMNNRKPWHDVEGIQIAIDGIKEAILMYSEELQVA